MNTKKWVNGVVTAVTHAPSNSNRSQIMVTVWYRGEIEDRVVFVSDPFRVFEGQVGAWVVVELIHDDDVGFVPVTALLRGPLLDLERVSEEAFVYRGNIMVTTGTEGFGHVDGVGKVALGPEALGDFDKKQPARLRHVPAHLAVNGVRWILDGLGDLRQLPPQDVTQVVPKPAATRRPAKNLRPTPPAAAQEPPAAAEAADRRAPSGVLVVESDGEFLVLRTDWRPTPRSH